MYDDLSTLFGRVSFHLFDAESIPWFTLGLAAILFTGFTTLTLKWYFQHKVRENRLSRQTQIALLTTFAITQAAGILFYSFEANWILWAIYDIFLAVAAVFCWWQALHTHGAELIDDKLNHIHHLCDSIEAQKQVVAQRDAAARHKSFLLNSMSHDLRTPLNSAMLNAELLMLQGPAPEAQQSLDAIVENVCAAGDMVARLLEYAKAGADDANHITSLSLRQLLVTLERRFQPIASRKGLSLVVNPADCDLHTDHHKLERIIANVIDNAIKYTATGSVTVSAELSDTAVTLRISDTGIGIPDHSIPHLFNEFYQVNAGKGFGLGLAICRSLAHQLHGDVTLEHTSTSGTTFAIRFAKNLLDPTLTRPLDTPTAVPTLQYA